MALGEAALLQQRGTTNANHHVRRFGFGEPAHLTIEAFERDREVVTTGESQES